jgi:hypothetical protein
MFMRLPLPDSHFSCFPVRLRPLSVFYLIHLYHLPLRVKQMVSKFVGAMTQLLTPVFWAQEFHDMFWVHDVFVDAGNGNSSKRVAVTLTAAKDWWCLLPA